MKFTIRIPPEERKLDPTSDRDSLGVIRNRVQWQLEACGANRTPFDPFKGFYRPGDVESSVTSTGPYRSGVFGHSPDLARTGHQIAPVFGSAKIALGEL